MQEEYLKTTWKQRLVFIAVAVIMLGSTITAYVIMIMNRGETPEIKKPAVAQLESEIKLKQEAEKALITKLSDQYFPVMKEYNRPASFNVATANASGVQKTDLKLGDGRTLEKGDSSYYAYYIGFCPDESIFDSSFDSKDNPTALVAPIPGGNLIEGWNQGIEGMKLGGVREIIMPGELAYGDTREICGMKKYPS